MADLSSFGRLDGFAPDARRALDAAAVEAAGLGHHRIGTEHLLLGLLDDDGPVGRGLRDAGLSLAAARHKVEEAVGAPAGPPADGTLPATKRASRAVEGALRISHQRRAEAVTSSDLLLGVLNVEGTAGQVVRGLGIDVDRVRAVASVPVAPAATAPDEVAARCPSCGDDLAGGLRHRVVTAHAAGGDDARAARVFSCGRCGVVLGVSSS